MIKFKEKKKNDVELLITKLGSKDKVNTGEVERLSSGKLANFLTIICEGKKSTKNIIYNITNLVTLKSFLSKPHTKESFINVLTQVANVMRTCEEYNMSSDKIVFDCQYVYVDYMTNNLLFLYYPIETYEPEDTKVKFIQEIASNTNPSKNYNADFIIDFRKYSDSLRYFSLVDFERKIESLSIGITEDEKKKSHKSQHYSGRMVFNPLGNNNVSPSANDEDEDDINKCICPNCHIEFVVGTKYCSECGENLTPVKGMTENADRKVPQKEKSNSKRQTKMMIRDEDIVYPSLLRIYNDYEVVINKKEFVVGYDSDCDYSFQENEMVSGHHAKFYIDDGKTYISDMHSTNGTYINDEEIPYAKKVLLNSGDKITLANEDFIFRGND